MLFFPLLLIGLLQPGKTIVLSLQSIFTFNGSFASLDQLACVFNVPRTHFFRYIQIQITKTLFMITNLAFPLLPLLPWLTSFLILILTLKVPFHSCTTLFTCQSSALQCKVVHRLYWSKGKLGCIYPGTDPNCDKCHLGQPDLINMFWTCPALSLLWKSVFDSQPSHLLTSTPHPELDCLISYPLTIHCHPVSLNVWDTAFVTFLARRGFLFFFSNF